MGSLKGQLTPGASRAPQVDLGSAQISPLQITSHQITSDQASSDQASSDPASPDQASPHQASPHQTSPHTAPPLPAQGASAPLPGLATALPSSGAAARSAANPGGEDAAITPSPASESDGLTQTGVGMVNGEPTPPVAADRGVRLPSATSRVGSAGSNTAPQRDAPPPAAGVNLALHQTSNGGSPSTAQPAGPSSIPQDSAPGAIATPLTVSDLALQTAAATKAGGSRFQIELHPGGLGRVDVSVQIGASGQLNAEFAFERPQAAADLSARSGDLKHALEQAGFNVADAGLSFSLASPPLPATVASPTTAHPAPGHLAGQGFNQGQGQSQGQGQGSGRQDWGGTGRAGGHAFSAAAQTAAAADQLGATAYASHAERGLDIRI